MIIYTSSIVTPLSAQQMWSLLTCVEVKFGCHNIYLCHNPTQLSLTVATATIYPKVYGLSLPNILLAKPGTSVALYGVTGTCDISTCFVT